MLVAACAARGPPCAVTGPDRGSAGPGSVGWTPATRGAGVCGAGSDRARGSCCRPGAVAALLCAIAPRRRRTDLAISLSRQSPSRPSPRHRAAAVGPLPVTPRRVCATAVGKSLRAIAPVAAPSSRRMISPLPVTPRRVCATAVGKTLRAVVRRVACFVGSSFRTRSIRPDFSAPGGLCRLSGGGFAIGGPARSHGAFAQVGLLVRSISPVRGPLRPAPGDAFTHLSES